MMEERICIVTDYCGRYEALCKRTYTILMMRYFLNLVADCCLILT